MTLLEFGPSPPLLSEDRVANVTKAFELAHRLFGKGTVIEDVKAVLSSCLAPEEIKLTGLPVARDIVSAKLPHSVLGHGHCDNPSKWSLSHIGNTMRAKCFVPEKREELLQDEEDRRVHIHKC